MRNTVYTKFALCRMQDIDMQGSVLRKLNQ